MKKTLYSLLLDDGVVREIDRLAHRNGMSRSSLVNQILADDTIGELAVIFRTQSASLLEAMDKFFRLWKRTEDRYLAPRLGREIQCALYENRYVRQLAAPVRNCSVDELAETISDYVRMFDRLMKGYLAGRLSAADVADQYETEISRKMILI